MNANIPEIFKAIRGFPAYRISNAGRVQSSFKGSWNDLKPARSPVYLGVILCRDKERFARRVHVLVALAFLSPKPRGKVCVRHLDGNPLNNSVSNLAWGTYCQNSADNRFAPRPRKKLSNEHVKAIYALVASGTPHAQIALKFGVHIRTIAERAAKFKTLQPTTNQNQLNAK